MQKRVRLADVAAAAGVSVATASKALHDRPRVGAEARRRVLEAAETLSYVPNSHAQSLVMGSPRAVGLITSDLGGMFSSAIMIGAEDALGASSSTVLLCNARGDPGLERTKLEFLLSRDVDGILVVNAHPNPRPPLRAPVPVVYAYAPSTDPADCAVVVDNLYAGRLAAGRLVAAGCRRIAVIAGEEGYQASHDRLGGARAALAEAGLELVAEPRFGSWSADWGRRRTHELIGGGAAPDAIICQSDLIAEGCIDALAAEGLRVPDDVAVIGHDNWGIVTAEMSRPLTTIDNELMEIGAQAARRLIDAVDGHPHTGTTAVRGKVIEGETVPPPL